jgi:hypothetical protein
MNRQWNPHVFWNVRLVKASLAGGELVSYCGARGTRHSTGNCRFRRDLLTIIRQHDSTATCLATRCRSSRVRRGGWPYRSPDFGYAGAVEDYRVCVTYAAIHHLHYHIAQPELLAITDDGWGYIPEILAYTVKRLSANKVVVQNGLALDEVDQHVQEFRRTIEKRAILFASPFLLPYKFQEVDFGQESDAHLRYGHFLRGQFTTPAEYSYWVEHGADAFGGLLEEHEVDAAHLRRPSSV